MDFYHEDYRDILAVLNRNGVQSDGYAARRACHELARIVMWRGSARLAMVEDGILRKLLSAIDAHVERDADAVVDVCRLLRRLIFLKDPSELDIQSKVSEAGYLDVFRRALNAHPNQLEVFTEICRVVALLCFDLPDAPHVDNQAEIVGSGLAQALVQNIKLSATMRDIHATIACEAMLSIVYENAQLSDELIELKVMERVLDFVELNRNGCDAQLLWHLLKLIEFTLRDSEASRDEFCRCHGPTIVIQAIQQVMARTKRQPRLLVCLYYVTCMLFCRLALCCDVPTGRSQTASPRVATRRIGHLVQSAAHQFALQILKVSGSADPHVAEQAVRLLELVASVEANRIPLTRLGASRQVKVVYNSTAHPGLLSLCERAVAAIEGT